MPPGASHIDLKLTQQSTAIIAHLVNAKIQVMPEAMRNQVVQILLNNNELLSDGP